MRVCRQEGSGVSSNPSQVQYSTVPGDSEVVRYHYGALGRMWVLYDRYIRRILAKWQGQEPYPIVVRLWDAHKLKAASAGKKGNRRCICMFTHAVALQDTGV